MKKEVINLRVATEEKKNIQDRAEQLGLSVTEYLLRLSYLDRNRDQELQEGVRWNS